MTSTTANDGFSIHEAKCPSCNGALDLSSGAKTVTCPFCDSTIHVSYGNDVANDEPSGVEPDGTIRDRGTGYGLFKARIAPGWQVVGTSLQGTGSSSRPHIPSVELHNREGGIVALALGAAGTRRSTGMNMLMGMYGSQTIGADRANYADVPDPQALADEAAARVASAMGASSLKPANQLACPDLEARKERGFARFQRLAKAQGAFVSAPFVAVVLRTYDFMAAGEAWKLASFVSLSAVKDGMGLGEGLSGIAEGVGNLMEGIGGLIGGQSSQQAPRPDNSGDGAMDFFLGGGLLGKMKRERAAVQQQQPAAQPVQQAQPAQQPQQPQQSQPQASTAPTQNVWCSPDFSTYMSGGTIYWSVDAIVTFAAPEADFDAQFESMFLPLVGSLETHPDIENLALQVAMQEAGQIGQATQAQLAQNQAAFQAQQAAHRQQQAAFNSYNQSISDARNARHQQFMASSHAQQGHAAPDYSEAIRGVNTYTTSDGREVELSVHADRAYENQAGDVIGASGGFEPGAGWTEIPRT